jgi:DNA-binding XRE family transcriptional regulator
MDYTLQIKKYRILQHMTQAELARKANIKQSYISQLEKDNVKVKSPTLKVIFRIAKALGVCPHVLVNYITHCNDNCCQNCRQIFL